MKGPFHRHMAATATFLLLVSIPLLALAAEPAAPAKETGDLWEVTTQMSMEGMPMSLPANTTKVCAPKEWKEPPGGADERHKCRNSDFKKEGAKATWKVVCAGPPEMTGDGEITRSGDDAYAGSIKFHSSEGNMNLKLNGKRLGTCEVAQK
jgi:uncharacterized protein DUF3617